jgi:ferredoxin
LGGSRRNAGFKRPHESGATLVEFNDAVELQGSGTFRSIRLARAYYEADKIINLPKLKTHEMMTMTCAVKNLFGAVVGTEKAGWHLKAGSSRELFAKLLLEIYLLKKPVLNIVDAITAMEGNGPGSGDPIEVGLLIAGANPVAVDVVAGRLAGIPADLLYIEREAVRMGLPGGLSGDILLCGTPIGTIPEIRFRLPAGLDVQFGLPTFIAKALKTHLTSYPLADRKLCVLCGICRDACPPAAITIQNSALSVDNARCIRCWCCRELCPHDAMQIRKGLLLRIVNLLSRNR